MLVISFRIDDIQISKTGLGSNISMGSLEEIQRISYKLVVLLCLRFELGSSLFLEYTVKRDVKLLLERMNILLRRLYVS